MSAAKSINIQTRGFCDGADTILRKWLGNSENDDEETHRVTFADPDLVEKAPLFLFADDRRKRIHLSFFILISWYQISSSGLMSIMLGLAINKNAS